MFCVPDWLFGDQHFIFERIKCESSKPENKRGPHVLNLWQKLESSMKHSSFCTWISNTIRILYTVSLGRLSWGNIFGNLKIMLLWKMIKATQRCTYEKLWKINIHTKNTDCNALESRTYQDVTGNTKNDFINIWVYK